MSFKRLFSRALAADPHRLHFAAHSHHMWPDASRDGQIECWDDAAALADRKWERVMGEIWPAAQAEVAAELGHDAASRIVFAGNTHELLVRLVAAVPRRGSKLRLLTSDGEFHSASRQFHRWAEDGWLEIELVPTDPFGTFSDRFLECASAGEHDLVFVSQPMFGSGLLFERVEQLAALARPDGPWIAVDGYHAFMAIERPFPEPAAARAFYLGGGYKYAMSGEGAAFLSCPEGFGPRPPVTGWFAEFDELGAAPGSVGYAPDAMRFMGATFDPSGLYRFLSVRRMLASEGLTTHRISAHVAALQQRLLGELLSSALAEAELLNPLVGRPHARFLAFRDPRAPAWSAALAEAGCVTDVRGEVLRIGLGVYHDEGDVDAFAALARAL